MSDDYEVGYGKPPKQTQFQKGESGNPKGRPKGTKNLKTDFIEELAEQVVINEGGRPIKLSKQKAIVKSMTNKAINGNVSAMNMALSMYRQLIDFEGSSDESAGEILAPEENEVLDVLRQRLIADPGEQPRADTAGEEEKTDE